jgi:hypothetical protein
MARERSDQLVGAKVAVGRRMKTSLLGAACALVMASTSAESGASPLERLLERQLEDVQSTLAPMCAPDCGEVTIAVGLGYDAAVERTGDATSRIVYRPKFMDGIRHRHGPSVIFAVLAHEYGHHLSRLRRSQIQVSGWDAELLADAFAGCALARADKDTRPMLDWMRHEHFEELLDRAFEREPGLDEVVSKFVPPSHPPWLDRIEALEQGARTCAVPRSLPDFLALGPVTKARAPRAIYAFARLELMLPETSIAAWQSGNGGLLPP